MELALGQSGIKEPDVKEIRSLLAGLTAAWDAGDGEAYGRAFTPGCDYITFNGDRIRGSKAVADSHQALFDTHLRGSRLIFDQTDMRRIGPDTMLVHSVGNSLLENQRTPATSRRSIQTLLAVRTESGWRFAAFHNTRIFKITLFRAIMMKLGL